jgi:hypothetical protein
MSEHAGPKRAWLAGLAAGLAIVSCYGTAAVVALLAALGVSVAINQRLWAGVIVSLTIIALMVLVRSRSRHLSKGPLALGVAGATLILWVMYGPFSRQAELTGFLLLAIASVWDWRLLAGGRAIGNRAPNDS